MGCEYLGDIDGAQCACWCEYSDGKGRFDKNCDFDPDKPEECLRIIHKGKDTKKMREGYKKQVREQMKKHYKEVEKAISTWPEWKRNILGSIINTPMSKRV